MAKGLCARCYSAKNYRAKTPNFDRVCLFEGCTRKPSRGSPDGLCSAHRGKPSACSVEGCGMRLWGEGLCNTHYREKKAVEEPRSAREDRKSEKARARKVGTTVAGLAMIREFQAGKCAVCAVAMIRRQNCAASECADHDHILKVFRGLLCRSCNLVLGHYELYLRQNGLVLPPFDGYLSDPPVQRLLRKT